MRKREDILMLIKMTKAQINVLEHKVKFCEDHGLYERELDYINYIERLEHDLFLYKLQLEKLDDENE